MNNWISSTYDLQSFSCSEQLQHLCSLHCITDIVLRTSALRPSLFVTRTWRLSCPYMTGFITPDD